MSTLHRQVQKTLSAASAALVVYSGALGSAHATLGGDVPSIRGNEATLGAVRQVQPMAAGERHDLVLPSGTVVREYVSPSGAVYAISWQGAAPVNLRELLGPYFPQFEGAPRSGGHHVFHFVGSDLVVRAMGHRHTYAGHAWVPSLVPPGVDPGGLL